MMNIKNRKKMSTKIICSICTEEIVVNFCRITHQGEDLNRKNDPMDHLFHTACIQKWVKEYKHKTCPLCQRQIIYIRENNTMSIWANRIPPRSRWNDY